MEFDAVAKILFHSRTDVGEIFRIFMQPDGPVIYTLFYRPFSSLIWWFLFLFSGLDFSVFHAFNFLLHAANSVLVFALARKLIRDKSGFFSFVAAAVFALHPVNLNVVLFVSRMPEMLVAFFLLVSLLSLNAFFEGKGKRFYLFSIFFCFAGIFSKESGALIPFVLLFYCLTFLPEKKLSLLLRGSIKLCAPFFSLIALYAALMVFSLKVFAGYIIPVQRLQSQVALSFFNYLFYPVDFLNSSFFNECQVLLMQPFVDPLALIASIAFAILVLLFFSKKRDKQMLFLFCWLFAFLFAFVAFSHIQIWYVYISLAPFSLLLAAFLHKQSKKIRKNRFSALASFAIAIILLSFILPSPLFVHYRQPLIASEITETVLSQTVQAAAELPDGNLFLLNYPRFFSSKENNLRLSVVLVDEVSVQIFLEFMLPEKRFKPVFLTESTIFVHPLDENQFSFKAQPNCVFLAENNGVGEARIRKPYNWSEEKQNLTGIALDLNYEAISQTITITLPKQECESAFFFFFDGKKVRVIKASEWS